MPATFRFDVGDHGATGDGVTDDHPAIQAALDAARAAGGGIVELPPGIYGLGGGRLQVPARTCLRGAGRRATVIRLLAGWAGAAGRDRYDGYSVIEGYPGDRLVGITLSSFTIDANESANRRAISASGHRLHSGLVDLRRVEDLTYGGLETINPYTYGLAAWDCSDVVVDGCRTSISTSGVYDQLDGLHLAGASRVMVTSNLIDQGSGGTDGDDAIAIGDGSSGARDVVVAGNIVRGGANGAGITVWNDGGTVEGVVITGNDLWSCSNVAIHTAWTDYGGTTKDVALSENLIRDVTGENPSYGIVLGELFGNDPPCRDIACHGNTILRSGSGGATGQVRGANGTRLHVVAGRRSVNVAVGDNFFG